MRLHATTTLRNAALVEALRRKGWTQADLARAAKLSPDTISRLVRLNFRRQRAPSPESAQVMKVAATLGLDPEDVIPVEISGTRSWLSPLERTIEVSLETLTAGDEACLLTGGDEEMDGQIEALQRYLPHLTERQRIVVTKRFNLDGEGVRTLAEIGRELGVQQERVRQIEAKALRRLRSLRYRDPAYSGEMVDCGDADGQGD